MRIFRGMLFLGSGEFSKRGVEALHMRLDDGISASSGLQQSRPGEEALDVEALSELEDIVRDVGSALLGREVHLGDRQPYPPDDSHGIHIYLGKKREKQTQMANAALVARLEAAEKALDRVRRLAHRQEYDEIVEVVDATLQDRHPMRA